MKFKNGAFFAVLILVVLWVQARNPIWNNHAQVDIWVFWERLNYYLTNTHSFAGLTGNEILPATLMYMFIPMGMMPSGLVSYANYLPIMMLLNWVIMAYHYVLARDKEVMMLLLLSLGPILIFRFDGLVTLTLLLALLAFEREKYALSGIWLGLSTGMKVFPIIFLPYLLMILWKRKAIKGILALLVFMTEAMLFPVMGFLLMGGSLNQIASALAFHSQKLISIESVPGSLITLWSLWSEGHPPMLIPGNGIWAVPGPAVFLNKFWILPVALMYLVIWKRKELIKKFHYVVPLALSLVFLIFSKNLNPQYMWWFMALLPFVKPSKMMVGLVLLASVLNQLVFPVFYTTFVEEFFRANQSHWIYYVLLARNICLVAVTYLGVKKVVYE